MRSIAILSLLALVAMGSSPALAQDKAAAEQLFKDGRRLMKAKDYPAACKKFEASHQLDSALGTLLNLATCLEKQGRTASAWARFVEARDKAKRAGQKKRVAYARKKARQLEKRLPRLKIIAPAIDGLEVRRDGVALSSAVFDTALPVDPGPHELVATAPGHKPFGKTITAVARKTITVTIPALEPVPEAKPVVADKPAASPAPAATAPGPTATPAQPTDKPTRRGRGRRIAGASLAASGLIFTSVGLVFGTQARSKWNEAFDEGHCSDSNVCNQTGFDLTEDARSKATLSTVFVGVGVAALGVGGYLYLTAPKGNKPRVEASVGRDQAMFFVRGGF